MRVSGVGIRPTRPHGSTKGLPPRAAAACTTVAVIQGLRLCEAKAEGPEASFTFEWANLQQISDAAQPLDDSQRRRRVRFVL